MRVVLQRVRRAEVRVEGQLVGRVQAGYLVLAGVAADDDEHDVDWTARKILTLRLFPDTDRKMNLSLLEAGGGILLVSQFTLLADVAKGRRPSFEKSARPEKALPLLELLAARLREGGVAVETGRFGAMMEVDLLNDGPVTIPLDSESAREKFRPEPPAMARSFPRTFENRLRVSGPDSPFHDDPLVLASASPRRASLLREIGVPFVVDAVDVDESMTGREEPSQLVLELAQKKARASAQRRTRGLVLGADTIVFRAGRIFGKPKDLAEAREMLQALSGVEHAVFTGVCIVNAATGEVSSRVVRTSVYFHEATEQEIDGYVSTGEPLGKAGAYAIQGRGALLVAEVRGDYSNVVGLPLGATLDLLHEMSSTPLEGSK